MFFSPFPLLDKRKVGGDSCYPQHFAIKWKTKSQFSHRITLTSEIFLKNSHIHLQLSQHPLRTDFFSSSNSSTIFATWFIIIYILYLSLNLCHLQITSRFNIIIKFLQHITSTNCTNIHFLTNTQQRQSVSSIFTHQQHRLRIIHSSNNSETGESKKKKKKRNSIGKRLKSIPSIPLVFSD